ncbi:unnamed protein product [Rhizoctonia solani]|uniref:Uncharacterized protein n=3 Tax=Rhizoctonia solani TaxID=456999 RepID=A0A8H2WKA7_9AGAM|nr:hypothetical protein RSOL_067030 [Rhizoctonia solani AG-3 Rhs1AP]KEP50293.1 hypothetical protein V565_082840 [Rhizoctonia solani 123E]CAE6391288.1 unnamed protein product [Rhizoctonia solani]CAE6452698.1 unnamed protein product [Rhizoctonia solani]
MASTESATATPPTATPPQPRYVPGAPPPSAVSKKKKKNKSALKNLVAAAHESALSDHAPDAEEVKAGKVDPSLLANPPPPSSAEAETGNNTETEEPNQELGAEKSLVVDAIGKRVKTLGKKVQRFKEYQKQAELNEDQKAAIASLPLIEASVKELESIKKTVEGLENSALRARNQERAEQQKLADHRAAEAAQQAEASLLPRITSLLSFLALRNLLTHSTPTDLSISEPERNAILSAGEVLLAYPPVGHVEEVVKGFLSGSGSWEDVEYSRLLEITAQFAAPRPPTPIPDQSIPLDPTTTAHEPEPEPELELELEPEPVAAEEPEPELSEPVVLGFAPQPSGGGFHFMQESELDVPATMSESQEWVSVPPTGEGEAVQSEEVAEEVEVIQAEVKEDVADSWGATAGADAAGGAPLDWAATGDEGDELPDLGGLQASFGGSGSATPVPPTGNAGATSAAAPVPPVKSVTIDDDGFTAIPARRGHAQRGSFTRGRGGRGGEGGFHGRGFRGEGGRGRGSGFRGDGEGRGGYRGDGEGRGGYRGDGEGRGGYRGDGESRGGYRGDSEGRGGYRGDGEGRGGYRGDGEGRGGYRGEGGEGGYRGRGRGGYRGGEGEGGRGRGGGYRGRGEGRGGGGYRGRSSSGNATPTAEAAAPA